MIVYLSLEWKGGDPDNKRLDRNGNLTRTSSAGFFGFNVVYLNIYIQNWSKVKPISVCSNGVTTGWDGTNRPGQLCMGTSPLSYGSPPRASGCQTSYWRTSECNNPHIFTHLASASEPLTLSLSKFSHLHPHMAASRKVKLNFSTEESLDKMSITVLCRLQQWVWKQKHWTIESSFFLWHFYLTFDSITWFWEHLAFLVNLLSYLPTGKWWANH